jgi:predicted ArsR family transcriptional regulator
MVVCEDVRAGVGRPKRVWSLAPASASRFPDSHGELAAGMIAAARKAFGEKGLDRLIDARTEAQVKSYRPRLPARSAPLARRVAALAKVRDEEGYLAASERNPDGSLTLVESHCPIGTAARACQGLCEGEIQLFRTLLGPSVEVERTEHVLAGGRRCAYRIRAARRGGMLPRT